MGRKDRLPVPGGANREHVLVLNAIPAVVNAGTGTTNRETMPQRVRVQIGRQRSIKGTQCLVIKVVGVIPKQNQSKTR